MTRKYNILLKVLPACVQKIQNSGGCLGQIQHSALPHAVLASQHAPLCCIFHTHLWRCFNYNICHNYTVPLLNDTHHESKFIYVGQLLVGIGTNIVRAAVFKNYPKTSYIMKLPLHGQDQSKMCTLNSIKYSVGFSDQKECFIYAYSSALLRHLVGSYP